MCIQAKGVLRGIFVALLYAAFLGTCPSVMAAEKVENLRIWHSPDGTRVVFDVSADVKHSVFSLDQPKRLVIDIEGADLTASLPALDSANPNLIAIRSGVPRDGVLRFVFELKQTLKVSSFLLSPNELYGHRLVLDLKSDIAEEGRRVIQDSKEIEKAIFTREPKPIDPNSVQVDLVPEPVVVSMPKLVSNKQWIVAVDAGHGGEDPGATGHRGSKEKKLTLAIAKKLKSKIDSDPRMKAVLIREGDYFIDLHKRRISARKLGADLFVSIHADAFRKKSARGFSVFALSQSGATSAMARALAAKENASDLIGGVSLSDKDQMLAQVLVDLSMTNTISESVNLGGRVLKELAKLGKLHSKRVEQAGFAVLKSPDMPSILVETGFITNPQEEKNLRSSRFQKRLAAAIYTAIDDYFAQTPYFTNASYSAPPVVNEGKRVTVSGVSNGGASATYHIVKRGDSLSKISARYNVTIKALNSLNRLKKNTVVIGQKIKLPKGSKSGRVVRVRNKVHKVRRGDTLSELSEKYGVSVKQIMSLNNIRNQNILLGQRLKIPN